ncbi:MAG: bacillithiol biosynthesis BshC, partial [Candidatus Glassbacteria bacterium]|nr:bacillithiol biosynthesis BshC [Candidatus Glassbacteria bacterium]
MADHGLKMVSSLAATNSLAADYLAGKEALRPFFGGHYTDLGRLKELAGKIGRDFDRARAARLLRAQETFPAVRQAGQRLERFVAESGFIVATGQQPVLFGGPLYVLYKALTLIKIAGYA